jgi:DNA-binding CsgD family transcriptional regulator
MATRTTITAAGPASLPLRQRNPTALTADESGFRLKCIPGPRPPVSPLPGALSPRERQVLALFARGFTYDEIARSSRISVNTVNSYARRIYRKLRVNSRARAVAIYMQSIFGAPV